jgi:hypothetical protein
MSVALLHLSQVFEHKKAPIIKNNRGSVNTDTELLYSKFSHDIGIIGCYF